MAEAKRILVTGATGYVGGRLTPMLLDAGYTVRAAARSAGKIRCRPWGNHPNLEIVKADLLDRESMTVAAAGCHAAYYLVHSMQPGNRDFAEIDRRAANNMVAAASAGGLKRIVYLGGLGDEDKTLSHHLRSRLEVARILQSGPVPTTFLRAAMILGAGSASFEIMRYLVEHLPVMIAPRWVRTRCQPISIRNVLGYLKGCLEVDATAGETFDIGGPDVLSYRRLFDIYAEEAGLPRRRIIPVPVLTPKLSSYWIHLVTPVPASLARPLAEGLRNAVVCKENRIRSLVPQDLQSCRDTIHAALQRIQQEQVETCWTDAGETLPPEWIQCGDAPYAGGTVLDCAHRVRLRATPEEVWEPLSRLGGATGWYYADRLWRLRGIADRLMGGVGLRRGRRHPTDLRVGDALDFWRVLEVDVPRRLVLLAEMKTPGEALLEFRVEPLATGEVELRQISRFLPRGIGGILYWYALLPFHRYIFEGMLRAVGDAIGKPVTRGPEYFRAPVDHTCPVRV